MGKEKTLNTNFKTTEHLAKIILNDECLIETLFLWMLAVLSYLSFNVPEKVQDINLVFVFV